MWPGFKSRRRRHMRVEFVVGSLLCSESFFFGYSGFPLSSKTKISKFQFDQGAGRRRTTLWKCYTTSYVVQLLYYILCCKNRNWVSPDLMQFWIFFVWFLFCFVFVFVFCFVFLFFVLFVFFLVIQSQAAFVNCLYEARFTIVHPKTQIKFPLLLLLLLLLLSYYRARNGGGSVAERLELQACKSSEAPSSSLAQLTASRICSR